MKFPSHKDKWITIFFWGMIFFSLITVIVPIIKGETVSVWEIVFVYGFISIFCIVMIWLWFTTYYILTDNTLLIKYGPFKKVIPYDEIRSAEKTTNPMSAPALSLKRIEIMYSKYDTALVSPKDRDLFLTLLKEKCPKMVIKK
ncbi:membrane protein YdbS with pleckstrin-like domain [Salirhabdus euzebyi]|uniref:Membrane protein YdbS with pleckstrin-like domain n=1 Tax=Salirhabdus euzebyi TaxID=394506 RepID=A0A841QAT0_9BACI|nr:PH domain-containing protein [Salirhabdus euzebyi]MBB6455393.1 membrane protein YdbS with pleckstrin-like domain [Salirhabdus euzebyi]